MKCRETYASHITSSSGTELVATYRLELHLVGHFRPKVGHKSGPDPIYDRFSLEIRQTRQPHLSGSAAFNLFALHDVRRIKWYFLLLVKAVDALRAAYREYPTFLLHAVQPTRKGFPFDNVLLGLVPTDE